MYELYRVPRDGYSKEALPVTLKLIVWPGDHGEPVMAILLPHQDYKQPECSGILPLADLMG